MHDGGLIKDCSYTNIVFYDGAKWYTPVSPLLEGTQRAKLIQEGIITPKALYLSDLPNFQKFKCINAMIHWDVAEEYKIDLISY
jgi:4-amino-4-deoxychorismate lyase